MKDTTKDNNLTRQQKAAITTKERHGEDFYKRIGRDAGNKSTSAPFRDSPGLASKAVGARWNRYYVKLTKEAIAKGLITAEQVKKIMDTDGEAAIRNAGKLAKERLTPTAK